MNENIKWLWKGKIFCKDLSIIRGVIHKILVIRNIWVTLVFCNFQVALVISSFETLFVFGDLRVAHVIHNLRLRL